MALQKTVSLEIIQPEANLSKLEWFFHMKLWSIDLNLYSMTNSTYALALSPRILTWEATPPGIPLDLEYCLSPFLYLEHFLMPF